MNQIYEIDPVNRTAWVGPGVINLDLSRATASLGLHFAPDPSSQAACTIGGNVANNSGGPHCLAEGSTVNHVLALEVGAGRWHRRSWSAPRPPTRSGSTCGAFWSDRRGPWRSSRRALVKLTANAPDVRTLLAWFDSVADAAATVSGVIAAGIVPAALEMMDQAMTRAVENWLHAGLPTEAAAILLAEVVGETAAVEAEADVIRRVALENHAEVRVAADEAERALLWKGRKSAFGAVAQAAPNYYLHDTVVPRTKLVETMDEVYRIGDKYGLTMLNVFHAGDGNLHPLMAFDAALAVTGQAGRRRRPRGTDLHLRPSPGRAGRGGR